MTERTSQLPSQEQQANLVVFANAELDANQRHDTLLNLGKLGVDLANGTDPATEHGFSHDDFRYFTSQQSLEEAQQVAYRNELLSGYEPFADQVAAIKTKLQDSPAKEIPDYLAAGNESNVFVVEHDGKKYAARISKTTHNTASSADSYVAGPMRGKGIDGLEQMVAISYEDGSTVSELVPGKGLDKYSTAEIAAIPDEHFQKLANTLIDSVLAGGIGVDGNTGNVMYDPEEGFTIVDYGPENNSQGRAIASTVTSSIFSPSEWLEPSGQIPATTHAEDYEVLRGVVDDLVPTFDRWLSALDQQLTSRELPADFFASRDIMQNYLQAFKNAQTVLHRDGATAELVVKAQADKATRLEKLHKKADAADNDTLRTSYLNSIERLEHVGPRYPKGNVRVSRNDNR